MKKWVAFFSKTGNEILNVSRCIGRFPDIIVTNQRTLENVDVDLLKEYTGDRIVIVPNRPSSSDYQLAIKQCNFKYIDDVLITLHGFLRIVPADICEQFTIINCHPGLITLYPELKGFDPQRRAVNYPFIGTVLHHVTSGVDEGPIISSAQLANWSYDEVGVTHTLKILSRDLWVELLSKKYKIGV